VGLVETYCSRCLAGQKGLEDGRERRLKQIKNNNIAIIFLQKDI
jgi:hypothetical protein